MMSVRYSDGAYNRAHGTRNAFGGLSDDLVREGHPPMVSISGDREYEDQLRIWNQRMVLAGDVRGRKVYGKRSWQGQTWYQIHPDTVAPPTNPPSSNHGKRRANDLAWPYNSVNTAAHKRARVLAVRHNITCEGLGFGEPWHWTFWGALGTIDTPAAPAGGDSRPVQTPIQEDDMATLIASPAGKSLVVGDRLFGFTGPDEANAVGGAQVLTVPTGLHARINDEFGRNRSDGALPTIVYVRDGNGTVYLWAAGKLEPLVDPSTLSELHAKNAPVFTLSQAEVNNLIKAG